MSVNKIIEREYRYLISKDKFNKLLNYAYEHLQIIPSDIQINYYYDDDMFSLSKNNISLKVRQIGQLLELQTEKCVLSQDVLPENEEENKFIQTLPNIIQNYSLRGSLVTRRRSFKFSNQFKLYLDENFYLGCVDFEVKIELYSNCSDQEIKNIINDLDLNNFYQAKGKSLRFYKKLHETDTLKPFEIQEFALRACDQELLDTKYFKN